MKFWQALSFEDSEQLVDLARVCEEVGFEGVHIADHLVGPEAVTSKYPYSEDGDSGFVARNEHPECFATIAAMAAVTTRLRFTTSIYIAPMRHPVHLAKAAGTVALLSRGRFALGAGVGWLREEFDVVGADFSNRGRRFDEMIDVMRKLWTGETVEHRGEHYEFERINMLPPPPGGRVPIYGGGLSPRALERAGTQLDGWLSTGNSAAEIEGILETLKRHRQQAGREQEPFEVIAAITDGHERDLYCRLEDLGVTGFGSWPLTFSIGPGLGFEQKREALERFGEEVIAVF